MSKTLIKVLTGLLSLIFGYGLYYFWNSLRPNDDFMVQVGVGALGFLASFVCLHFLTKGSGGD
ncbi:hypothetical protein HZC08_00835 [Candidatus Micrarchaeota archaeon]|nr:hypothetical protein [Candidatus Micrarchaeota archaeon]